MNAWIGSFLALAALVGGGLLYGWRGVILALSVVVFWLLLQFSRLMRVMGTVQRAPVGQLGNAVMFQAQLKPGLKMLDLLPLAGSLGRKQQDSPLTYEWTDAGGVRVEVVMEGGRLDRWQLIRPEESTPSAASEAPSTPPGP
jgi:hypothetical protein